MSDLQSPKTLEECLNALEKCTNASVRARNIREGAPDNQFGVTNGDIRKIAKSIKSDHELALELWATGHIDAMLLATLIMKPTLLTEEELEQIAQSLTFAHVADYFTANVVKQHPSKETMRLRWMHSDQAMLARAGWSLTTERVTRKPEGLDLSSLLDRIEHEMGSAPSLAQWTMNHCLVAIGIRYVEHRPRALDIGAKVGLYRDYKASKGCTSPFAPTWIGAMVARQAP